MSARSITFSIVAAVAVAFATPAMAGQGGTQNPPPAPKPAESKPDAKSPVLTVAAIAGKWTLNIDAQSGPVAATLDVKADPTDEKKFTGTIASQQGEAALQGSVAEGKFTFAFTMAANGNDLNVTFVGTQQKDGSLAGTLNFGQGDVNWTGVKAK